MEESYKQTDSHLKISNIPDCQLIIMNAPAQPMDLIPVVNAVAGFFTNN